MLNMALLKEKIKVNMIDTLTCRRSKAMAFDLKGINSFCCGRQGIGLATTTFSGVLGLTRREFRQLSGVLGAGSPDNYREFRRLAAPLT